MRSLRLIGGYTSIVSGILLALAHMLNLGGVTEFGTVLGETLVFLAHLLLVFTFFGVYIVQDNQNGILGLLGLITGVIGTMGVTSIVYVEIAGASGLEVNLVFDSSIPSIIHLFGPLFFVIGMIFSSISVIRNKILPHGGGYLLIMGTFIFVAGTFVGETQAIIQLIGSVITGAGFIWLGMPMIKKENHHMPLDDNNLVSS